MFHVKQMTEGAICGILDVAYIQETAHPAPEERVSPAKRQGTLQHEAGFVYESTGRTFRRLGRRNSAGHPPRRRAARHAVRPAPPPPGKPRSPGYQPPSTRGQRPEPEKPHKKIRHCRIKHFKEN